jgi:CheY-like chemotaxis protein
LTGANAVVAAGSGPGRLISASLPEIDQPVGVIFLAADGTASLQDELRLPGDYSVIYASTVEAAVALSKGHRLDLVILDLGPSALEGLAVLRQLKADPVLGIAPLVLFGAFEDMSAIRQGLQLGARDYLIRGETTPSLVARRLRSWLDVPAMRALSRRAFRLALAAPAPVVPPAPVARTGLAELFGGSLIGLIVLLLKETRFLVAGRVTKRP